MLDKKSKSNLCKLNYHLVVVTKYREECITPEIKERLFEIAETFFQKKNCEIVKINGGREHLNILFNAPPQVKISSLVNSFKIFTERCIKKEFSKKIKSYGLNHCQWSYSHLIMSAGFVAIDTIQRYIEEQNY